MRNDKKRRHNLNSHSTKENLEKQPINNGNLIWYLLLKRNEMRIWCSMIFNFEVLGEKRPHRI